MKKFKRLFQKIISEKLKLIKKREFFEKKIILPQFKLVLKKVVRFWRVDRWG
jgi:hypothetical protein